MMRNSQSKISPSTHRSGRKSSLLAILTDLPQSSPTSPSRQATSIKTLTSIKDYRRLKTSDERIAAAHKAYKRDILEKYGTIESTLDFDKKTIDEFMEEQKVLGLTSEEVVLL